jgi:general secretion pathway protein G
MQENTRVVLSLTLAGGLLAVMGVGVWLVIREDGARLAAEDVSPLPPDLYAEGRLEMVQRAVGPTGILDACIERFHLRMERYPRELTELLEQPADAYEADKWDGPYLSTPQLIVDPWGNAYRIRVPGIHNEARYDLWSAGPDQRDDTADDIGNW